VCSGKVFVGGGRVFSLGGCGDEASESWAWVFSAFSIVEASGNFGPFVLLVTLFVPW
jgi:hypothetical protein